jgi:hypothetical protein
VEACAPGRASRFIPVGLAVAVLGALAGAACESKGDARRAQLFTVSDLQALLGQDPPTTAIVDGHGLPGGMSLQHIITGDASSATLVQRGTFSNGYKSAYVTTEVWTGFDEVWIQPVYVAVEAFNAGAPPKRQVGAAGQWRPIFGVGPDSAFYSPYWQTVYFQIAPGDDVDTYRSVKDVLARGRNFRPSEPRVMAFAPAQVAPPTPLLDPQEGQEEVGEVGRGIGLYDGQEMPFLDFGTDTFTWDQHLVVEEAPLYVWVARGQDGQLHQLDMPTVAGSGPPYSRRDPLVANGKPQYGSYWRIYTVEMQPGWRVFVPPYFDKERARLADFKYLYEMGVPYADALTKLDAASATSYDQFVGRVLTNPSCVTNTAALDPSNAKDPTLLDPLCVYVDSQRKIEDLVPSAAIHRTDILVTCPFTMYEEQGLVLP